MREELADMGWRKPSIRLLGNLKGAKNPKKQNLKNNA